MLSSFVAMLVIRDGWWLGRPGRADDDAAAPWPGVKRGAQPASVEACGKAFDKCQVHAADQVGMPAGQLVKRAVTQPDGAGRVSRRLEAVLAQRGLRGVLHAAPPGTSGPMAFPQVGACLTGCRVQCGAALAVAAGYDGRRQQARGQFV